MSFVLRRMIFETVPKSVHFPDFWGQDKEVGPNPLRGLAQSARQDKRETRFPLENPQKRIVRK